MGQLTLDIATRLSYAPEDFLLHEGVHEVLAALLQQLTQAQFSLCFTTGERRSGKTHLSIRIMDDLARRGVIPLLLEGAQFERWLNERAYERLAAEVIVIDDADRYFRRVLPGNSGPFVACIEHLRVSRGRVLFLSAQHVEALPCDEHVVSRLTAGVTRSLDAPAEGEIPLLVSQMARQRGILLNERMTGFVVRRVGRDISAIERSLQRVDHLARALGKNINMPLLSDAL